MLRIQGASDDIVSANIDTITKCEHCGQLLESQDAVHGHVAENVEDEFGCYEQSIIFTIGEDDGGVVVEMFYTGVWGAKVHQLGEDIPIPWPVTIKDDGKYSVVVDVACPNGTKVRWMKRSTS